MGGLWTWRVVYRDTTGALPTLLSSRFYLDEAVQADASQIVEQIRDYKDPRYASAVTREVSWFRHTSIVERGSASFWTLSQIWIRNSTSHKWQVYQTTSFARLRPLTTIPQQRPLSLKLVEVSFCVYPSQLHGELI